MIYVITTLKTIYGYKNPVHQYELGKRTVGYFNDLEKAKQAVEENWGDIYENGYYPFCVIEEKGEGIYNIGRLMEIWYKWIDGKYKLIEKPKELMNICCFGLG